MNRGSFQVDQLDHCPVDRADCLAIEQAVDKWTNGKAITTIAHLGGLTNRVFKVEFDDEAVVIRLPGLGTSRYIDRAAELHNARLASELEIGATVLFSSDGVMITGFIAGRSLSPPDLLSEPATLERAGRLLRRLHTSDRTFDSHFEPGTAIDRYRSALPRVPTGTDDLVAKLRHVEAPPRLVPCHNDPWPENFIDAGAELRLVDWEYSAMGDPAWDLADLCVEANLDRSARRRLLHAYCGGEIDQALQARVESLGPVTDLFWGLWSLVQDQDGNQADDFASYGRARLSRAASG